MSKYKSQIQNQFLSLCRKKHTKVEVILETGTVLRGKLKAYDQFSVSLSFRDKVEVVYKSSIIYIAIMPPRSQRYERNDRGYDDPRPPNRNYDSDSKPNDFPDVYDDEDDPPPPKKPVRDY